MNNDFNQDYLMHYGVLGMKWGVRRYENKGGSYTKKGVDRFRKTEAKYEDAKTRSSRSAYKLKVNAASMDGNYKKAVSKAKRERRSAIMEKRAAKAELNKNYKQLKRDFKADQGKALYSQGTTIGSISTKDLLTYLGIAGATKVGAAIAAAHAVTFANKFGTIPLSTIIYGVGAAAVVGTTIKNERDKSKLRAYYAHY